MLEFLPCPIPAPLLSASVGNKPLSVEVTDFGVDSRNVLKIDQDIDVLLPSELVDLVLLPFQKNEFLYIRGAVRSLQKEERTVGQLPLPRVGISETKYLDFLLLDQYILVSLLHLTGVVDGQHLHTGIIAELNHVVQLQQGGKPDFLVSSVRRA